MLEELYLETTGTMGWISNSITGYDTGFYSYVYAKNKISTIRIERNPLRGKVLKVQKVC